MQLDHNFKPCSDWFVFWMSTEIEWIKWDLNEELHKLTDSEDLISLGKKLEHGLIDDIEIWHFSARRRIENDDN